MCEFISGIAVSSHGRFHLYFGKELDSHSGVIRENPNVFETVSDNVSYHFEMEEGDRYPSIYTGGEGRLRDKLQNWFIEKYPTRDLLIVAGCEYVANVLHGLPQIVGWDRYPDELRRKLGVRTMELVLGHMEDKRLTNLVDTFRRYSETPTAELWKEVNRLREDGFEALRQDRDLYMSHEAEKFEHLLQMATAFHTFSVGRIDRALTYLDTPEQDEILARFTGDLRKIKKQIKAELVAA